MALPLEVLHMVLHLYRGISEKLFGVGFKRDIPPDLAWCASNWLQKGLIHIRQSGLTPLAWHRTKGVAHQQFERHRAKGKRVVHTMDPIGKGFFAHSIENKGPSPSSHMDHCFLPRRRKEPAMLVQMCGACRLNMRLQLLDE